MTAADVLETTDHYPSSEEIFAPLDATTAAAIARDNGTPVYLIAEQALRKRIRATRDAAAEYPGTRITWSFKTNSLSGILALMRSEGLGVEVVSDYEYSAVRAAGIPAADIVFNGPARSDEALADALRGGAVVNLDHREELERLIALGAKVSDKTGRRVPVGFRVNTEGRRRFGFSLERGELDDAVARVAAAPHLKLGGFHNQMGANIRDLERFARLGECFAGLARKFCVPLDWIDVGGSLAGTNARLTDNVARLPWIHPRDYCRAVLTPLAGAARSFILEPGRSLIEPTGALLTRVVGVRTTPEGLPAYILDAGINSVSSASSRKLPMRAFVDADRPTQDAALYGPLCMGRDRIAERATLPVLRRGDLLLVEGVGAYDIARNYAFILPRPGVLLWSGAADVEWLRRPETREHIQALETPYREPMR
jgi:diaminopimelate decarboxylase